ncbi:MAG: hypothetical protein ACLGH0_07330 [Thermoanaerobaculia bacterium]
MSSQPAEKVVNISLNSSGMPVPDQDPIEVWRNSQKIRWCAPFEFQISIDGYSDVTYSKGGNGNSDHFCKTGYFGESASKKYKYTISANGVDNDPEIEVKP